MKRYYRKLWNKLCNKGEEEIENEVRNEMTVENVGLITWKINYTCKKEEKDRFR